MTEELSYDMIKIVPYIVVLIGALVGFNVFAVLISGTVVSLVIGIATGSIQWQQMFVAMAKGPPRWFPF